MIGEPSKFIRSETLADYYLLTWEVDIEQKNVTFEVKAQTTGYVGFGVNTIGGMQEADIVIGGVFDNGTSYFAVCPNITRKMTQHASQHFTTVIKITG